MDHRLITALAVEVDDALSVIIRACTILGKDRKTVLDRIADEISHGATRNFEPLKPRDAVEQAEPDESDPELRTQRPAYSDPTGEQAVKLETRHAEVDAKRVVDNLHHALKVFQRTISVFDRYPDVHLPTPEELKAAREVERVNAVDLCQHCLKEGQEAQVAANLTKDGGATVLRLCSFCIAHHEQIGPCPECGGEKSLPTRLEVKNHYQPPKRMSA
jgi:hypothetical protein